MKNTLTRIQRQLSQLTNAQICAQIGRQRQRFPRATIARLLAAIAEEATRSLSYRRIHRNMRKSGKIRMKYSAFMHAIGVRAPLFERFFLSWVYAHCRGKDIQTLALDSTLVAKKELHGFDARNRDHIVVMRHKTVCGRKAALLTVPGGPIVAAWLGNIREHDSRGLNQGLFDYLECLGVAPRHLLADRAHGSEKARNLSAQNGVHLVSPFRKNQAE